MIQKMYEVNSFIEFSPSYCFPLRLVESCSEKFLNDGFQTPIFSQEIFKDS